MSLILNGKQIKELLDFVNPDGEEDLEQLESEITIREVEGDKYAWFTDYPEEGSIKL